MCDLAHSEDLVGRKANVIKEATKAAQSYYSSLMVWSIVLYHAHHLKLLVQHGAIVSALKNAIPLRGGAVAYALARITEEDCRQKKPLSTAVVVGDGGVPGMGFFRQARELGYEVGNSGDEELTFWRNQLQALEVAPYTLEEVLLPPVGASKRFPLVRDPDRVVGDLLQRRFSEEAVVPSVTDVTTWADPESFNKEASARLGAPSIRILGNCVFTPPGSLKVGDHVLLPKSDLKRGRAALEDADEVTVASVKVEEGPNRQQEVVWVSTEGKTYRMSFVGTHLAVRSQRPLAEPQPGSKLPGDSS